jgi:CBS domain-containing protein
MRVREIMTASPTFCTPETVIQAAAKMMCDADCGAIPVLENSRTMRPLGVLTDRDIAVRAVAQGLDPRIARVRDFMTAPAVTVTVDVDGDECASLLERNRIRRVLVVDDKRRCVGIVSVADIARKVGTFKAGELVRGLSEVLV